MRRTAARTGAALLILFGGLAMLHVAAAASVKVTIGSKAFTESVILGEMLGLLAREAGAAAEHRRQLGGTRVLWNALLGGEIDAYPEYTGTLMQETLAGETLGSHAELERALAARGLRMSQALGFNNTYAIGVKKELAERLGLRSISDLKDHPGLVLGFGNEFMDRADGWPGLQRHYDLPHRNVRGLDHDLAYRGIAAGSLQVTDLYTTFARLGGALEHVPTDRVIEAGDILLLDTGSLWGGYSCDFDRNYAFGHASNEAKAAYDLAWRATATVSAAVCVASRWRRRISAYETCAAASGS